MYLRLAGMCLVTQFVLAQAPHVTDTKLVDNWEEKGKGPTLLRKINGRWWSPDNREVQPPGSGGFFWTLDSKPGTCQFFHHRPVQLARAESLRIWMTPDEVQAVMGEPNRILGQRERGFWFYYAANGVKLTVRFMQSGELGEATYQEASGKARPVQSVVAGLNGQDLYKALQARNTQRLGSNRPRSAYSRAGAQPTTIMVDPAGTDAPRAPKRLIPAEAVAAIAVGASREDVVTKLGEPSARYAITDDDGTRESFTYDLTGGDVATIRLLNGRVFKVQQ